MCVFVNFVFSNAVFMHSHTCIDGHVITHSHPYLPSSGHGHTAQSLDHIAGFNAAASSMKASCAVSAIPQIFFTFVQTDLRREPLPDTYATATALRGPPAVAKAA